MSARRIRNTSGICIKLSRFARDKRGVSAVEFALLAPMMIGLSLGGVEISEGISADRKVTLAAGAVANLAAQTSTISASDMTNLLDATTTIMAPYSASNLKITVSCINIDANKTAKVKWSATRNGTAQTEGATITLPSALQVANTQLLYGEASYDYKPTIGYVITGTLALSDKMYMSPRISPPTYGTKACT
jgi:Flp pilus assembly protein TadG